MAKCKGVFIMNKLVIKEFDTYSKKIVERKIDIDNRLGRERTLAKVNNLIYLKDLVSSLTINLRVYWRDEILIDLDFSKFGRRKGRLYCWDFDKLEAELLALDLKQYENFAQYEARATQMFCEFVGERDEFCPLPELAKFTYRGEYNKIINSCKRLYQVEVHKYVYEPVTANHYYWVGNKIEIRHCDGKIDVKSYESSDKAKLALFDIYNAVNSNRPVIFWR